MEEDLKPSADMNPAGDACPFGDTGHFGGAALEYPLQFDLRVIYRLDATGDFAQALKDTLAKVGVPCSLIQGVAKPLATYGRMGARVTVDSKARMDALYAAVAALPGVKAVI